MITPNHGLSGFVCAQVAMPLLRRYSPLSARAMGLAVFLGAMLPDGDILTRLVLGREAYFSGAWYGHRGFSHSIAGTLVLALLVAALLRGLPAARRAVLLHRPLAARPAVGVATADGSVAAGGPAASWRAYGWLAGCLWAGGLLHLFGDLFTPGWQMPVFWPLAERLGGWQHIGWFSPYLLWLFLATLALAGALGWAARRGLPRLHAFARWAPALVWGLYSLAALRWVTFLVGSRYESRGQWAAYHETLLPDALIAPVTAAISTIWHWFTG